MTSSTVSPSAFTPPVAPTGYRVCPVTRRKIDLQAQRLIKVNAVVAVVALLVGAIAALLLALTRWQAVHLLPATWYYRLLGMHGMNMLIFFIIFFEMAVLWFVGTVLLNARPAAPRYGWFNFGLMLVGALTVEAMQVSGRADVLYTSYPPLKAHPAFYLGIILFAVGALGVVAQFFATLTIAKREKTYAGSVPLVVYGAIAAAIIAVITLLHGAMIYIPTFLWSLGLIPTVNPQIYRLLWWALGHSAQQINVAAMVSIWYMLGALTVGAVVLNEKVSRWAFVLYILFISMASAHHLLVDPGFGPAWKIVNTSYFMYMAVLASMVHGFTVPAGMELGMRLRGFTQGLFGWLRRAPWGDPGFSSLILSVVVFGFFGGITGVTIGTEQINIIAHNTLRVPGHFHATVVSGTAVAFMGATYYLLPLIFQRKVAFWKLAKLQPYLFAGGMLLVETGMTFAGSFGVPRRHWDNSFAQSPFDVPFNPAVDLFLAMLGIGAIIAVAGALSFILIAVKSVFFGEKVTEFPQGVVVAGIPQGLTNPPVHVPNVDELNERLHAPGNGRWGPTPGTLALVGVFFMAFMLYYFTNWKLLSFLWKIG